MGGNAASFALVAVLLAALVGCGLLLRRRFGWEGEASRKFVHIGMGCVTVAFPWMFDRALPVVILAAVACVAIASLCYLPALSPVLREIDRESFGELYFPIGVAFCFYYSAGDPVLYCPPVLMLTFADALAALIGKRFGVAHYTTDEGFKSWEGSAAFFAVAFLTTTVALLILSPAPLVTVLLIGILFGMVGVILEAIAWKGLDNLFIPILGLYAMSAYVDLSVGALVGRIFVLLSLVAITFAMKRRSTLNDSALLGVAITLYLAWTVGGWAWGLSPFAVFALYPLVVRFDYEAFRDHQSVSSLLFINLVGFLWLAQGIRSGFTSEIFWPYSASYASHLAMIWTKRVKEQRWRRATLWSATAFPALSVLAAQSVPLLLLDGGVSEGHWAIKSAISLVVVVVSCGIVMRVRHFDGVVGVSRSEWLFRCALSGIGSGVVFVVTV